MPNFTEPGKWYFVVDCLVWEIQSLWRKRLRQRRSLILCTIA